MTTGMRYVSSSGATFDFDRAGVYPVPSEAWDWAAEAYELNGELSLVTRGPRDLSVPVTIAQVADPRPIMEELYSVAAADLAASAEGRLYMGEWYLPATLVGSEKRGWWRDAGPVSYDLTFHSPRPWWVRETTHSFYPVAVAGSALDYPHDYPYDYGGQGQAGFVSTQAPYPCDFVLRVYGPATNPYVIVGDNRYEVDVTVPDGGLLVIDSEAATVTLMTAAGAQSNAFPDTPDYGRSSGSYVFEPIRPGDQQVSWDGTFGFDLVLKERRDERAWTA